MKAVIVAVGCAVISCAVSARADLAVGATAPEIAAKEWLNVDEEMKLSDARGLVVILFFWVPFHEGGQRTLELINSIESNSRLGRVRGVMVIGLTEGDAKRTEPVLRKEKTFFPVGVESQSGKDYRISSFPRAVIIDPDGKVAWTGWPAKDGGNELAAAIVATLVRTPPTRTHPLELVRVNERLESARTALRKGRFREAFEAARDALEHAVAGDPISSKCADMIDLIEALGRDELAGVDDLIEGDNFDDAVRALRDVARQFRGLEVSKTARSRLAVYAQEYAQIAGRITSQESSDEARTLLIAAQDAFRARRFGEACELLEQVVGEHAGTDEADRAQRIMARMETNPKVMGYVRNHKASRECTTWLATARSFVRVRRTPEAKKLFRKIIQTYPNTSFAEEAAEELSKLP